MDRAVYLLDHTLAALHVHLDEASESVLPCHPEASKKGLGSFCCDRLQLHVCSETSISLDPLGRAMQEVRG